MGAVIYDLCLISVCGHLEMIDILQEQGCNLERPDTHSAYPIHYAAQMCGNKAENDAQREKGMKMLKKFIDKKVSLTCEDWRPKAATDVGSKLR